MRLIDADELVRYLKQYHSMSQGVISDVEHFPTAHMAIEALEKQATSEWIPVSERLPDKNGTYLITVSSYDETASIEYITVDHGNSDGGFLHFKTKKNPKAKSGEVVTAWMPAPEPYKEGEQDD